MYGAHQILGSGLIATPVIRCYPGMRGYQTIPNRAAGTSITGGTAAYGTPVQMSTGLPYDAYIVGAMIRLAATANHTYERIGIILGPSSSSWLAAEFILRTTFNTGVSGGTHISVPTCWPYPVFVPAGTGIWGEIAQSAGANAFTVWLLVVPASEIRTLARMRHGGIEAAAESWPDECALPALRSFGSGRALGMFPGASLAAGAAVTAGTTPAYGSYATINAGFAADYLLTHLMMGAPSDVKPTFAQVGLGIGPAGSEYLISEMIAWAGAQQSAVGDITWDAWALPVPLLIPAGSRLAIKYANSTNAATANFDVNGVYVNALSSELAAR